MTPETTFRLGRPILQAFHDLVRDTEQRTHAPVVAVVMGYQEYEELMAQVDQLQCEFRDFETVYRGVLLFRTGRVRGRMVALIAGGEVLDGD